MAFAYAETNKCRMATSVPVFTPLGGPSVFAAWRGQYLRRLARPVFTPLGEASIYAAWRGQYLRRLANPVFVPLGGVSPTQYQFPETTIKDVYKEMDKTWVLAQGRALCSKQA